MSQGTTQRAGEIKETVTEQTGQVAGTAKEQAQQVASEATARARDLAGEARDEVRRQTDTQRERLAGTLHQLGDELGSMAEQGDGSGIATEIARQAADRAHGLGSYVEHHEPGDLLNDVRAFARRRPGTFLLGALAAGVLAGRATRGAKAAVSGSSGSSGASSSGTSWSTPAGYSAGRPPGNYAATPPPVTPATTTTPGTTGVTPGTGPLYEAEIEVETDPAGVAGSAPRTGRPDGSLP